MTFTTCDNQKRAFNRSQIASISTQTWKYRWNPETGCTDIPSEPFEMVCIESVTGYGWTVQEPFEQVKAWLDGEDYTQNAPIPAGWGKADQGPSMKRSTDLYP